MNDLEVHHKFGILVFIGVVTMRGRDQNFFHAIVDKVFNVFTGQIFEYFLTARLADAFATAILFDPKNTKIHPCGIKDIGSGSSYLFHSRIVGEVAAGVK